MATPKLQTGRALQVLKSDNCFIPFPQVLVTRVNTSTAASELIDASTDFVNIGIKANDIVYNTTDGTAATVVSVVSAHVIKLNANIFTATSKTYVIYNGDNIDGAVLYVGGSGDVKIVTEAGDTVTLVGVNAGSFLPVYTRKVLSATTATNIVALW